MLVFHQTWYKKSGLWYVGPSISAVKTRPAQELAQKPLRVNAVIQLPMAGLSVNRAF